MGNYNPIDAPQAAHTMQEKGPSIQPHAAHQNSFFMNRPAAMKRNPVLENPFERPDSDGLLTAEGRQEPDQECIHAFRRGGKARDYAGCVAGSAKRLQQTLAAADDMNGHQRTCQRPGDVRIGLMVG